MKIHALQPQIYTTKAQSFGYDCDNTSAKESLERIENKIDKLTVELDRLAKNNYVQHRYLSKNIINHEYIGCKAKEKHDELYNSDDFQARDNSRDCSYFNNTSFD